MARAIVASEYEYRITFRIGEQKCTRYRRTKREAEELGVEVYAEHGVAAKIEPNPLYRA
jgi:hypothetical protein